MGLPPKSYFHLTEIAERWNASIQDLACYTLDGLHARPLYARPGDDAPPSPGADALQRAMEEQATLFGCS